MAKLIIRRAGGAPREVPIQPTTTIGRLRDCTVQLEDPQISRVHVVVTLSSAGCTLTDQGSMNGTLHNGERMERGQAVDLLDGDVFAIADFELRVALEAAPEPEEALGSVPPVSKPQEAVSADAVLSAREKPPASSVLLSHLVDSRHVVPVWSQGDTMLKVVDIINETSDTKTYRLTGLTDTLFSYKPGQFITITLAIDGQSINRSYSVSSSPSRPHTLELTIKRVRGGLVSNWMADHIALGDEIPVRGPSGKFSCFNYPSRKILCIAGGSGVTPIMSMLRWIVDTAADVDVVLIYSSHTPADFIFRKELETISARHSNLRVLFTVTSGWTGSEAWTGLAGYINAKMIELVAPDVLERHIFMCGPKPFSEAMKEHLGTLGFPTANLHTESFGEGRVAKGTEVPVDARPKPQQKPKAAKKATQRSKRLEEATPEVVLELIQEATPELVAAASAAGFRVRFATSNVDAIADSEQCLLDLAETHGVEIDYACRAGSCGSCKTRCVSGTVTMDDNDLDADEIAQGWIYPCIAKATSDVELEV